MVVVVVVVDAKSLTNEGGKIIIMLKKMLRLER